MTVISFDERARRIDRPNRLDWSNQEIADFYHAQQVLRQQGVSVGIDRGVTDIGEPWLVLFDNESQDVFVHIARINRRCILVSEALGLKIEAANIGELVNDFEVAVRRLVRDRSGEASNVVLHPTARIILSLALLILLLKFDGNHNASMADEQDADAIEATDGDVSGVDAEADAELHADAAPAAELDAARRADILSRAQAFLARASDSMPVDAPTAMAGAAQLMLLAAMSDLEAAENRHEQAQAESERAELDAALALAGDDAQQSDDATEVAAQDTGRDQAAVSSKSAFEGIQSVLDEYRPAEAGSDDISNGDIVLAATGNTPKAERQEDGVDHGGPADANQGLSADKPDESESNARADEETISEIDAEPEPEPAVIASEPLTVLADSTPELTANDDLTIKTAYPTGDRTLEVKGPESQLIVSSDATGAIDTSLAAQLFNSFELTFDSQKVAFDIVNHASDGLLEADDAVVDVGQMSPTSPTIDVAFASLDHLLAQAGFVQNTQLGSDSISETLRATLETFVGAEVEFSGGNVLIEQAGVDDANPADLGVWVNTLSDDSQIIIVGQAAVVDSLQSAVLT